MTALYPHHFCEKLVRGANEKVSWARGANEMVSWVEIPSMVVVCTALVPVCRLGVTVVNS